MATVYLAEDVKHERKVALKVLRPELAVVVGGERFLREIKIAAQLVACRQPIQKVKLQGRSIVFVGPRR